MPTLLCKISARLCFRVLLKGDPPTQPKSFEGTNRFSFSTAQYLAQLTDQLSCSGWKTASPHHDTATNVFQHRGMCSWSGFVCKYEKVILIRAISYICWPCWHTAKMISWVLLASLSSLPPFLKAMICNLHFNSGFHIYSICELMQLL